MNLDITLTNKGIAAYEEVLELAFAYVDMLKKQGIQQWVFDELRLIGQLNFANKDKENPDSYALSLASRLQYYPVEEVLVQPYLNEKYDEVLIASIIASLTVDNVRINIVSKEFEAECQSTEPIYGTRFVSSKIDEKLYDRLSAPK